jgi:hypothetical protein
MISKKTVSQLKKAVRKSMENKRYLRTAAGKKLLMRALELKLNWPELEEVFGRRQTTLEKVLSYHGISKSRNKPSDYSEEQLAIVKEKYALSAKVTSFYPSPGGEKVTGRRMRGNQFDLSRSSTTLPTPGEGKRYRLSQGGETKERFSEIMGPVSQFSPPTKRL